MKEIMHDFDRQTSQRFEEYNERAAAGIVEGIKIAIKGIKGAFDIDFLSGKTFEEVITGKTFNNSAFVVDKILQEYNTMCVSTNAYQGKLFCNYGSMFGENVDNITAISANAKRAVIKAGEAAAKTTTETTKVLTAEKTGEVTNFLSGKTLAEVITGKTFNNSTFFVDKILQEYNTMCVSSTTYQGKLICSLRSLTRWNVEPTTVISANAKQAAINAGKAAERVTAETTKALTAEKTGEVTSTSAIFSNPMVISFIVVVIIVIILLIIYLILRYRRKKKMKRKLQYIKLLKE
ncbi:hypothetical protein PFUGPA_00654 [Plasmodium falciparum Palo Alto/Uganda]|uniref:Rifin n=1 Tax=Plasmodium falciparum (isolate Palo Alto / Uganda) TaxID=57270 RepID=W4J6U5_PLAFP|nr:hypothetical protein PFUGPA_00654 [Plasmodium falciparum Palo Alto/Uganda]